MTAAPAPLVSIIVNNFNYGRFIGEAIDSALAQTHPRCEVIVVDDGSTDDSVAVIERFGPRVVPLFQANGGQGAAMNAGFARSRGEVVLFLDSDDALEPHAVERSLELFAPDVDRIQFALQFVDESGASLGSQFPARGAKLETGVLASRIARAPIPNTPPTSGNAFSRRVLQKILPMPAADWRICADSYLLVVSALYGAVAATDEPLGRYRVHQKNNWNATGVPTADQLLKAFDNDARKVAALRRAADGLGIVVDRDWELANPTYLDLRLFMLLHHPDRHPFPADSVGRLARIGIRRQLSSGAAGAREAAKSLFYASLPLLPAAAARALTEWKVAPDSRPWRRKATAGASVGPAPSDLRICVVSECALNFRHGTGAQMVRLFDWQDPSIFHLYLTAIYGGTSETGRSLRVEDPLWLGRGRRVAKRVERAARLHWWNGDEVRADRLRARLARDNLRADVAYVVAAHEEHALKMNSLLRVLGCPYVLHLMDIYHPEGLDPARMPGFRQLIAGASGRLAITDAIAAEIGKFGGPPAKVIPIGQELTQQVARERADGEPLRFVMVGKPYAEGMAVFYAAWDELWRRFPDLEVYYSGRHVLEFPEHVRARLRTSAYVSHAEYEALLARSHVAFLSGPLALDRFGKFSIASRIADYLMAGLPVVGCVGEGTAMERFLRPIVPQAVRFARTPEELLAGLAAFRDPGRWREAHEIGRRFAVANLDIREVRRLVRETLVAARGAGA